jgi:hypothetical protein
MARRSGPVFRGAGTRGSRILRGNCQGSCALHRRQGQIHSDSGKAGLENQRENETPERPAA